MTYIIIQGRRSWSSNKNGNLSLPMHSRSFSSLPPRDGPSLADGECGRAQNDPSIIAYKKIVHHDDGNVGKKKQDDGTTTIIREEKKKNDDHDGDSEFWFHHQLLQVVDKLFAHGCPRSGYGTVSLMGMAPTHNLFGVVDEHLSDGRQLKHNQDEAERHPTSGQRETVESHLRVDTTTTEKAITRSRSKDLGTRKPRFG